MPLGSGEQQYWFRRSSARRRNEAARARSTGTTSSRRASTKGEERRLLDAGERGQRHGSSPTTATAGPLRTVSRNPEGAANSAAVRIVVFTGRHTAASTRVHAS